MCWTFERASPSSIQHAGEGTRSAPALTETRYLGDLLDSRRRLSRLWAIENVDRGEDEFRPSDLECGHQRGPRDLGCRQNSTVFAFHRRQHELASDAKEANPTGVVEEAQSLLVSRATFGDIRDQDCQYGPSR